MQKPAIPQDEPERLSALRSQKILDTAPEPAFDDLTRLAAEICETPIALLSLVDETRQWFKSRLGTDLAETPREVSFCGHAILSDALFIVEDATKDPRFCDNPLVLQSGVVFYAGAPVYGKNRQRLGTLCVIDSRPRTLNDRQRQSLQTLSAQVTDQLELRRKVLELMEEKEKLTQVVRVASVGQMTRVLAHDINNPLAVISGTVHRLQTLQKKGEQKAEVFSEALSTIKSSVQKITKQLQSLHVFLQAPQREQAIHLPLADIFPQVLGTVAARFEKRQIELACQVPAELRIEGRPEYLTQAFITVLTEFADRLQQEPTRSVRLFCEPGSDPTRFIVLRFAGSIEGAIGGAAAVGAAAKTGEQIVSSLVEAGGGRLKNFDHAKAEVSVELRLAG